ncbi:hypothetical protein [Alteromonas sp. CYL-A6]|uniref:hypothetical protein n=1 Tax=Alteromonas nitratireducens TaxID=3390813 RepID=UPI0034AE4299
MKAAGILLLALGAFAGYGTWRLLSSEQFIYHKGITGGGGQVYAASDRPEDFRATVIIAGTMNGICLITGVILLVRSGKK